MTREEAFDSVKENVENENSIKHMLATEAIMRGLAKRLGEDEEECAPGRTAPEPKSLPAEGPRRSKPRAALRRDEVAILQFLNDLE